MGGHTMPQLAPQTGNAARCHEWSGYGRHSHGKLIQAGKTRGAAEVLPPKGSDGLVVFHKGDGKGGS